MKSAVRFELLTIEQAVVAAKKTKNCDDRLDEIIGRNAHIKALNPGPLSNIEGCSPLFHYDCLVRY